MTVEKNVQGFRLTNGEFIIGNVVIEDGEEGLIVLDNVLQVVTQQSPDGRVNVGLQPFIPFAEGVIELSVWAVSARPRGIDAQLLSEYNRLFSTIISPSSDIILP